jgi:hypothetical protein
VLEEEEEEEEEEASLLWDRETNKGEHIYHLCVISSPLPIDGVRLSQH